MRQQGEDPVMDGAEALWVFGYGSLMWNPGFVHEGSAPACIYGFHRSLCIYSYNHRGTPERPGLVLGLDKGGCCKGIAFRVAPENRQATVAYLREREQISGVYREELREVRLTACGTRVPALVYVVDRDHRQYAGRLSLEEQLRLVQQGHGKSGPNGDYVANTAAAISALGLRDPALHWLSEKVVRAVALP